jgi:hypothetical protein
MALRAHGRGGLKHGPSAGAETRRVVDDVTVREPDVVPPTPSEEGPPDPTPGARRGTAARPSDRDPRSGGITR